MNISNLILRLKYLFGLGIPMVIYRSSNLNLVYVVFISSCDMRSVLASDQEFLCLLRLSF
ncbi:hypothetical protein ACJX0J_019131, partial [Zea mays]